MSVFMIDPAHPDPSLDHARNLEPGAWMNEVEA